jgi:hypothetical protein
MCANGRHLETTNIGILFTVGGDGTQHGALQSVKAKSIETERYHSEDDRQRPGVIQPHLDLKLR